MRATPSTVSELLEQPFTIHSVNAYAHTGLANFASYFGLKSRHLQIMIRSMHHQLVTVLASNGINYTDLQNALVPRRGRQEVAYVFDSSRAGSDMYGEALSRVWLPALRTHGPVKTVIRHGDILHLPSECVWRELEQHLVGRVDFPRLARELYYVVYLTNLSGGQVRSLHDVLGPSDAYLGYVDCSTWTPLKGGLFLPQIGLRLHNTVITDADDGGTPNQIGYPFEKYGFEILGVEAELYGPLLGHRLDNGVPDWADADTGMALSVLGGESKPMTTMNLTIEESRVVYLGKDHGPALTNTGLAGLDAEALSKAIKDKLSNGLIYRLRFVEGSRDGVPDASLDAMMFTVQLEFPDASGAVKRYELGMKYRPGTHTGEIVTFY